MLPTWAALLKNFVNLLIFYPFSYILYTYFHQFFCVFNLPQGHQCNEAVCCLTCLPWRWRPWLPHPAGDGDDGAQTWKQLTQAQTCCWSNLITHIMCHYWAGRAAQIQHLPRVSSISTEGLHSHHVTSHVHPNLLKQTIHYNRRMSEYRPVIFISSGRFHVQFTSSRTTWGCPPPTGQLVMSILIFFCHASEIPVSAFGQLPKVLLPQLSVRSGAVIKCDSWYCVPPSCPRILPAACTPSLILVTVFNGTPSVMKKWWMFSENYWSDRHNWLLRRDNQIESLVPLTAGAHNSCFSWAIR